MSNDTPGPDPVQGWGQPKPEPGPEEGTAPWPAEAVPPETPWPAEAVPPAGPAPAAPWATTEPVPAQPAPPAVTSGSWGAPPPQQPQSPVQPPVTSGSWGAPPVQQPQPPVQQPAPAPSWGAPPPQPPVQPVQQPVQQPAPAPAWGAPPPQQAPGWAPPGQQPAGGWAPPPQQSQGWAPGGPGAPGGPPVGWGPPPVKSGGNGCLKGCLIVGAIGLVLVIIAVVAITVLGLKFAQDIGVNPDGSMKACSFISNNDLSSVLGGDAQALPLGGIADATIGQALDKRIIPTAEDCWITASGDNATTGRLARQAGGDASGAFRSAVDAAKSGGYYANQVTGVGDEAFCTGMSEVGSFGLLARKGDQLVYVSLIGAMSTSDLVTTPEGMPTSPKTCSLDQEIAKKILR